MSKRIDLTQFEEMEDNRPWSASWYPAEEEVEPDFLIEGGAEGYKVRIVNTQGGITLAYIANGNEVLAKQIAKLPDLLAELKRMYERETELLTALQVIKEYTNESQSMDNIKEYVNNVCDTNLPYWGCACQGPHSGPC